MPDSAENLSVALFSEMFMADQLARTALSKVLPKGMELSHFSVLNHLANAGEAKTPAGLARTFHVTRGAMTNTLGNLPPTRSNVERIALSASVAMARCTMR